MKFGDSKLSLNGGKECVYAAKGWSVENTLLHYITYVIITPVNRVQFSIEDLLQTYVIDLKGSIFIIVSESKINGRGVECIVIHYCQRVKVIVTSENPYNEFYIFMWSKIAY